MSITHQLFVVIDFTSARAGLKTPLAERGIVGETENTCTGYTILLFYNLEYWIGVYRKRKGGVISNILTNDHTVALTNYLNFKLLLPRRLTKGATGTRLMVNLFMHYLV